MKKNKCSYEDENGNIINECNRKPLITCCEKCDSLYITDKDGATERMTITLKELNKFIQEKENESDE